MEPAWRDEDDSQITVDLSKSNRLKKLISTESEVTGDVYTAHLRQFYSSLHNPTWASSHPETDSKTLALLRTSKPILSNNLPHLPPKTLDISQLKHANADSPSSSVITSLDFKEDLFLTAGRDKRLKIFKIDEVENPSDSVVYLKDLPIQDAFFLNSKVYISGDRPFFYTYDVPSQTLQRIPAVLGNERRSLGRMIKSPSNSSVSFLTPDGKVLFVSTLSNKLQYELRMNGEGLCGVFGEEYYLYTAGVEGEVYCWDLRMRRCYQRFADEGSVRVTSMDVSSKYLATGSSAGIVNMYELESLNDEPKPKKSLLNLTTSIDGVKFNPTGEILAFFSRWKADAIRFLHTPSLTVYSNWPSFKSHIKFPFACGFSEDSRYVGVGNDEGQALLYKLNYYASR